MTAKVFDNILATGIRAGQVPARTKAAREWYRDKAQGVTKNKVTSDRLVSEMQKERGQSDPMVGSMMMFVYDAKHKATLPYYDKFPLVFPIEPAAGGFLGLNMHYLPPNMRAKLMDALYTITNNKRYNETTKLRASYGVLKNASKFRFFAPTIKHYLLKQVRSKFIYVAPAEWDIALFLPTANWSGASAQKVYADSRKIIQGG